jgi:hypothetical protein
MTLRNYKKLSTPFVFLDETGSINDRANRYFAIGIIKSKQPYFLDYVIRLIRQKFNFFDEIKWNTISKQKVPILKEIIDQFFVHGDISFATILVNKESDEFDKFFNNDPYSAYQKLSELLIKHTIRKNEVITILADYISTPKHIHFEVDTKHAVNKQLKRLAVAGIHRIESSATNLLQLTDLLLGAVAYEYKIVNGLARGDPHKKEVMEHLRNKVGCQNFSISDKTEKFTVIEFEKPFRKSIKK